MEKNLTILLLISIILLILILIIINLIIINKNRKIKKIVIDYNYNNEINYPSLLVLNNKGKYTTTIENNNDKIMLVFGDRRYIKYTFIDINNCQIINKENPATTLLIKSGLKDLKIFSFDYRLYVSANYKNKMRILSIQMKRTYKSKIKSGVFFYENDKYMILTDEFKIYEIDDINFNIKNELGNLEGLDKELKILTNIININNNWCLLCINKQKEIIKIEFNKNKNCGYLSFEDYKDEEDFCKIHRRFKNRNIQKTKKFIKNRVIN